MLLINKTDLVDEVQLSRVQAVVRECNANYNFRQLCCEYLERLRLLVDRKGDRLRK